MELKNKKAFGRYYAKHFQAGTCKYEDNVIFVDNPTIKQCMASFDGKPTYIDHQIVDEDNLKDQSHGAVVRCFYNELDGWYWLEFLAFTTELEEKIQQGWSVSNAYSVLKKGEAGTWHNNPYDFEVLELEFNHLAIVETPRYEQSCIMTPDKFKLYNEEHKKLVNELKNSIDRKENKIGGKRMFQLFKTKKEAVEIDDNISVQLENGKDVSLKEMVCVWNEMEKKKEEENKKNEKTYVKDEEVVKIGENEVSIKELKKAYNEKMKEEEKEEEENKKKNEIDEEEKKKEEEEENKKKNEADEEEKKKEEEENKNSIEFTKLENAIQKGSANNFTTDYLTIKEKIENGKKRY